MMDAREASESRVYSSARMKRRQNKQNQNPTPKKPETQRDPRRGNHSREFKKRESSEQKKIDPSDPSLKPEETHQEKKQPRKKHTQFHPDLENINPEERSDKVIHSTSDIRNHHLHERTSIDKGNFLRQYNFTNLSDSSIDSYDSYCPLDTVTEDLERNDSVKFRDKFLTLCSLLPDEILRDPVNMETRFYQTAMLFPDVSGFTQLCQKYDKTGMGGPSRLTAVLNGYIGSMIKIVLSRHGDVCKFGGDAFLCIWKVTEDMSMTEIVHLALESAIDIQKSCGEHKTDVGVKLRVKMAVSAGKAAFSIIGSKSRKYYVVVGPPVLEVRDAEQLCRPGDIIVSPSAWKHVNNYMYYSFTYHSDNKHIKVHDFGPLWKSVKSDLKNKATGSGGMRPFLRTQLSVRVPDVKPFILPPVMRSIDLNRSLDYLTEMRQIAVVFFNVILDFESLSTEDVVSVCDGAFKIVSGIVDTYGGGTNKLTLFDKDMAILTVFGLKGFKHELASQVALKCAYECLLQLNKLNVDSASAGVTTGMAYCGVIGHSLRKEYTVMGHPVNMAARLMCFYRNMVSCDRSTFLNSKLESGHFEVLEVGNLKGIQNAGPFYRFNVHPRRAKLKLENTPHPLLGRGREVQQFQTFLQRGSVQGSAINFFIVFGAARIGKTRLVGKLINVAQLMVREDVKTTPRKEGYSNEGLREIHAVLLTGNDSKVSYSTIRLIFQPLLGLSDSPSVQEKEDKILSKLGDSTDLNLLAFFNQIFNVNFDLTPQYLALEVKHHANTRMTWLKQLYSKCFPQGEKWLIVIDDAEFVDDESWRFLLWCSLESQKALYLLTIGQKRALTAVATECVERIKAKRITLTELEKWFYLGLACQILEVRAIPVELESLLQGYKSSGNPGWLESFLLSLIQAGSIYISHISSPNLNNLGLVAPPEFMLSTRAENKAREDSYWVDYLETFESAVALSRDNFRVCLLGPNFRGVTENGEELTMDVIFIRTMDGLKPLEQLVLKAASVLGHTIQRNALAYVITKDATVQVDDRSLAKVIKNLFEMKILTCAKGDNNQKNQLISKRIAGISNRNDTSCECTGLRIPESCRDLPRYANCVYMQFRFSTFRETVYNSLLDEQKKKFHNGCIEFLRNNTYRCKSCKNVRFSNVFGYLEDDKVVLACTTTPMHGIRSTMLDPRQIPSSLPSKSGSTTFSLRARENRSVSELKNSETDLGVSMDLGDCQCSQILASLYSVLLEHAKGSGRKDLMLEIWLESASIHLTMYNIPLTMHMLEEALALLTQMEEEYPELCIPYIFTKIYSLMGATKLSMGRLDESLELLKKGLGYIKETFPTNRLQAQAAITKHGLALLFKTQYFPKKFIGKETNKATHVTDLLSECLGLICVVYMYMQDAHMAKLASLWSLNKALRSNRNLYVMCTAYTNLIEVSYCAQDLETCSKMEMLAIEVCKKCQGLRIELFEWEAIGKLYKVIFQTRHVRAEIEEAIYIGFQSIKIASIIHSTSLKLDLIPELLLALMQMNRLSEAVTLLQELEFISRLDSDKSSRLWYYAICLDFQLYTGFTIVPYEVCESFVKSEELMVREPFAKYRLSTCLWLWCIRNREFELVKSYGSMMKDLEEGHEKETPSTVFTRLQRLEGLLIHVVHKMEAKNIQAINAIFSEIHLLMGRLKRDVKVVKLFKPRFQLLKVYYRQIRYRDESYFRSLNQAQSHAEKMKDFNTSHWIMHLKMLWSNSISAIEREHWTDHCRKSVIEWHETNDAAKQRTIMYSLPLPKY